MLTKLLLLASVPVLALAPAGIADASPRPATVTIVHGLPGFTADVYVNDELILDGFEPTTATDPIRLDPGTYDVDIRELGAEADATPVLSTTLSVKPGANVSIVAHLTRSGDETVSVFTNRFQRISAGRSVLLVRDVAATPAFWVNVDGRLALRNLRLEGSGAVQLAPGPHRLRFVSRSTDESIVSPARVRLQEGSAQIVYVIGSADTDSLDLMLQTVGGIGTRPANVLTGDGDLAAEPWYPTWALVSMGTAVVAIALWMASTRRHAHV